MPRSPSRDLADRFTSNRGYFRQPDGVRRAKNWLALVALGMTGGWAVVDAAMPGRVVETHSHGTLASVHAPFETNCEACHKAASSESLGVRSAFQPNERWLDLTCQKCHAGPAHHAKTVKDDDGKTFNDSCANCHHDHDGKANSLVRIADSHCVYCHANLPANHVEGKYEAYPAAEKIKDFTAAGGHPEFREFAEFPADKNTPYPRVLKFSHSLHMAPGQAVRKDGRKWTLADLTEPAARGRYRTPGQADGDGVQLRCDSCHQLDGGSQRSDGAYFLPINYDAHCKACHPNVAPAKASNGFVVRSFDLPHGRQPTELKDILKGEYSRRLAEGANPALAAATGPGGRLDAPGKANGAFHAEVERLASETLSGLMSGAMDRGTDQPYATAFGCGKCHDADRQKDGADSVRIAAVQKKAVWFTHAKFNHAAHRATACAECHPNTGTTYTADNATVNVIEREPIQIRGIASCRECHSPAGGVRHSCTDCHRYHNGDHPLQGLGAKSRSPDPALTVSEFLRGGR